LPSSDAGKLFVGITVFSPTTIVIVGRDQEGGCFGVSSDTSPFPVHGLQPGTTYWWDTAKRTTCTASRIISVGISTETFTGPKLRRKL
jgi:hypothetical protein